MPHEKFDASRLERLDDETRFEYLDPELIWTAAGRPDPAVIVDVGAGTGLFARRFATMCASAIVYAADTEPKAIRWMREHDDPALAGRVVPLLAEETQIPLPDRTADVVVTINLHHELADPRASYQEALRLLRPGGRLIAADWARTEAAGGPPLEIRATDAQVAEMLGETGFEDIASHGDLPRHWLLTARKPA